MTNNFPADQSKEVQITSNNLILYSSLTIPKQAIAAVIFAHGSGSSRFSPRNQYVAKYLNKMGFATLLSDLLTQYEETIDRQTLEYRFNIQMLAERLILITDWALDQLILQNLRLGYFGSSTGAAAALIAAAKRPSLVQAIVSRGGRPDLAEKSLPKVQSPTLLIVGGLDNVVIGLNQKAQSMMSCMTQLKIVPGAAHLFEEPGKLDEVIKLACEWFNQNLV